jgi:hypothetical protein
MATRLTMASRNRFGVEALSYPRELFPVTGDRMTLQTLFELSPFLPLAMAFAAVFVAATASSTVGFAFSAFAAGLLFQIMSDKIAVVEIMLISSIAVQVYCVALLWRHITLSHITWYLLGGILALPIGLYLLFALNAAAYSISIGVLLSTYGAVTFVKGMPAIKWGGRLADALVGAIGGITGPLLAFPGAAVAIWCGTRGWDKLTQRCVYQPYILIMQVLTLVVLVTLGGTKQIDMTHGLFVIPAILGAHLGFTIFGKITDIQFKELVSALLVVSGLWLLAHGLE